MGGRIGTEERTYKGAGNSPQKTENRTKGDTGIGMLDGSGKENEYTAQGRFPANILLDEEAAEQLGGPSRFFYVAKASRAERNMGLEGFEEKEGGMRSNTSGQHITRRDGGDPKPTKNNHPTVKPLKLMRYLVKLTKTPTGGIVLDPFVGSGTTAMAAKMEGRDYIGIDMDEEYCKIARARVASVDKPMI